MKRRQFILISGISTLAPAFFGNADEPDTNIISDLPPLPDDLQSLAQQPPAPYTQTEVVGTAKPTDTEIDDAWEILLGSPFGNVRPIDVAQYFLAVGAGAFGQEYRKYTREWPVRANPLIFHFFSATQTAPEGDVTPWCAAFVNWCLLRAHATKKEEVGKAPGSFSKSGINFSAENLQKNSTNSAASGSFRCWAKKETPEMGDIAVFKDRGTDALSASCRGSGHVTFVHSIPRDNVVRVIGGNQSQRGSNGAITVADMSTAPNSRFMQYVSLR